MSRDLPGLGSGALRAALAQRIKECRETAERWKTESRNVRIDRAIHKDYSIALDALANLLETALSLSSPIEPAITELGAITGEMDHDTPHDATCVKCRLQALANRPTPQASSEIREALEQIDGKHLCQTCGHRRGEHAMDLVGEHFCEHDGPGECTCDSYSGVRMPSYAELVSLLRALAPSRQGAAKRVEG